MAVGILILYDDVFIVFIRGLMLICENPTDFNIIENLLKKVLTRAASSDIIYNC